MKCPQCGETPPFILCPECKGEIRGKSRHCCWFGNPMTAQVGETDLSERKLCRTEIVIDEEGVCNICGKPYSDSGETAG